MRRRPDTARWLAVSLLLAVSLVSLAALARPGGGQAFSGRSSPGGGGDGAGALIQLLLWLCIQNPAIGIPVILLVIVGFAVKSALGSSMKGWSTAEPTDIAAAAPIAPAASVPRAAIDRIRAVDPEFSVVLFEDFVYLLYAALHRARAVGTEGVTAYLAPSVARGLANPQLGDVTGIIVGAMRWVHFSGVGGPKVELEAEFEANYVEVDRSGRQQRFYVVDRLLLERASTAKSRPFARARTLDCPNCGAPLEAIRGTRCSHCQQDVGWGRFDWMVSSFHNRSREERGPLLTSRVAETGTDRPTLVDPGAATRFEQLVRRDPALAWPTLQARIGHIFGELQGGWTACDPARIRPYLSDNLFQSMLYWIELYTRERCRNVNQDGRILRLELANVLSDLHYDAITVRMFASGLDYTMADDGRLLSGDRHRPRAYSEYWTLIRGTQRRGQSRGDTNCPNCGAPLRVGMAGNCEYCQVKVTSGEFDWVLSRIEQDEAYSG